MVAALFATAGRLMTEAAGARTCPSPWELARVGQRDDRRAGDRLPRAGDPQVPDRSRRAGLKRDQTGVHLAALKSILLGLSLISPCSHKGLDRQDIFA